MLFANAYLLPLIVTLVLIKSAHLLSLSHLIEKNDFESQQEVSKRDIRICRPNSVCGVLNKVEGEERINLFCNCGGDQMCPINWDSQDGHSITRAGMLYKFCEEAPSLTLCNSSEDAFTSTLDKDPNTDKILKVSLVFHCTCPDDHDYELSFQVVGANLAVKKFSCENNKNIDNEQLQQLPHLLKRNLS
uniref:SLPTX11 n=1 Tax=Hemiscolopendra marginata TaxID=943146 RepID=A0A646QCM5_9MYRI